MKIIIVNDNDKPKKSKKYKKKHFKKKAKKRIADDRLDSPVKKSDYNFSAYGKRMSGL